MSYNNYTYQPGNLLFCDHTVWLGGELGGNLSFGKNDIVMYLRFLNYEESWELVEILHNNNKKKIYARDLDDYFKLIKP